MNEFIFQVRINVNKDQIENNYTNVYTSDLEGNHKAASGFPAVMPKNGQNKKKYV